MEVHKGKSRALTYKTHHSLTHLYSYIKRLVSIRQVALILDPTVPAITGHQDVQHNQHP